MMVSPEELVLLLGHAGQGQAHKRSLVESKASSPVGFHQRIPAAALFGFAQPAPVQLLDGETNLPADHLHWILQSFPHKQRPQRAMPLGHLFPRVQECSRIQGPAEYTVVLNDVDW